MSDERRNDKRAIFMLRLASEDFDKKPSPHGLLDYFDGEDEFTESDAIRAALRELDRLTAERDAARAELAKLREACEDVPWMLERAAGLYAFEIADVGIDDNSEIRSWREQSQYLRAALESEAGE